MSNVYAVLQTSQSLEPGRQRVALLPQLAEIEGEYATPAFNHGYKAKRNTGTAGVSLAMSAKGEQRRQQLELLEGNLLGRLTRWGDGSYFLQGILFASRSMRARRPRSQ